MAKRQNRFNQFQSTLSVRRATESIEWDNSKSYISIHALRKESDYYVHHCTQKGMDFNPRSP